MIVFYTAATPNGRKIAIALEEMGLPYQLHALSLDNGEQKTADFLSLNPNGKIPVIVDQEAGDLILSESGAILLYLAQKSGMLMPTDTKQQFIALQWLMFQMSAIGPMMGQAMFFNNAAEENIPFAIKRFNTESLRVLAVLDRRLAEANYLAGEYSIADIATYPWVAASPKIGLNISDLPHLQRWLKDIGTRPAVQKGMAVPE